ncbi:hypothetical protein M8542_36215 [Amycolatopsis sp. OK19-0408]|uniref:Uncharacterized protein n=1 Tax=Amycolatopsis iheyensis TaxID=2945988 RepID=A0A9X2SQA6_9PSEU|nr:hypothetical protein [Amycolatopsis iheyensis]MCR6488290.1 hypothetical protein [Amycolatopsis iheyensis]
MEREFDGHVQLTQLGADGDPEFPARIRTGTGVIAGFTRETTEQFVKWINMVRAAFGSGWSAEWDGDTVVMTLHSVDWEQGSEPDEVVRHNADGNGRFWFGGRMFMWDTPDGV